MSWYWIEIGIETKACESNSISSHTEDMSESDPGVSRLIRHLNSLWCAQVNIDGSNLTWHLVLSRVYAGIRILPYRQSGGIFESWPQCVCRGQGQKLDLSWLNDSGTHRTSKPIWSRLTHKLTRNITLSLYLSARANSDMMKGKDDHLHWLAVPDCHHAKSLVSVLSYSGGEMWSFENHQRCMRVRTIQLCGWRGRHDSKVIDGNKKRLRQITFRY